MTRVYRSISQPASKKRRTAQTDALPHPALKGGQLTPETVLSLQRMHGNQFVQRLLKGGISIEAKSAQQVIQRVGEYSQLGGSEKSAIDAISEADYYEHAREYEMMLGRLASVHPIAIGTAKLMIDQAREMIKRQLGVEEETWIGEFFGTTQIGNTGSVGTAYEAVMEVFEVGNLREQMTLLYNAYTKRLLGDFIGVEVFGDPSASKDIFSQPDYLQKERGEREQVQDGEARKTLQAPEDIQFPPLSHREKEFAIQGGKLQWEPGLKYWKFKPSSDFVKKMDDMGMPYGGGTSGTTLAMMKIALALGVDNLYDVRLACLGWMLPAGDHTFHEIMAVATEFGLEYTPGPLGYRKVDPLPTEELLALTREGHFPDYYLSDTYKDRLVREQMG